jgi:hypothetical protein
MNMVAVVRRDGKWWIMSEDDPEPIGPYDTRAEAEADARGLRRFAKYGHLRSFVTVGSYLACVVTVWELLR